VDWIQLVQVRGQWWALANRVDEPSGPIKGDGFLD
jgi:hypothetical protein